MSRLARLLAAGLVASAPPSAAGATESPLLDLLARVPLTTTLESANPLFSYADLRAVEAAMGVSAPTLPVAPEQFAAALSEVGQAWHRVYSGPPDLFSHARLASGWPDLVGFQFFAIDRGLSFGMPPAAGFLIAGQSLVNPAAIGSALTGRGFVASTASGLPIWSRGEDSSLDFAAIEPADPFGGHLGRAARVALLGDAIAYSPATAGIAAIAAAAAGDQPSLADHPAVAAMVGAIADNGVLIQAQAFDMAALASAFDAAGALLEPDMIVEALRLRSAPTAATAAETLAPFGYALIADGQDGNTEILTIAVAYPDAGTADAAAALVARRLTSFVPASRAGAPSLFADISPEITARSVTPAAAGPSVAVVTAAARPSPASSYEWVRGIMFRHVIEAIYRREFTPLSVLE